MKVYNSVPDAAPRFSTAGLEYDGLGYWGLSFIMPHDLGHLPGIDELPNADAPHLRTFRLPDGEEVAVYYGRPDGYTGPWILTIPVFARYLWNPERRIYEADGTVYPTREAAGDHSNGVLFSNEVRWVLPRDPGSDYQPGPRDAIAGMVRFQDEQEIIDYCAMKVSYQDDEAAPFRDPALRKLREHGEVLISRAYGDQMLALTCEDAEGWAKVPA